MPETLPKPQRDPSLSEILSAVCAVCRVTVTDMMGRGRHGRVTNARRLYAYCSKRLTLCSYPQITRGMGKRGSHSTMVDGAQRFTRMVRDGEPAALSLIAEVEKHLGVTLSADKEPTHAS